MPAELDFAKVVYRLGIDVADTTADPDNDPDVIWLDGGRVLITPKQFEKKVATPPVDVSPVPFTLLGFTYEGEVDEDGYLSLNGERELVVIDLTSESVNPRFDDPDAATHTVSFTDLTATIPGIGQVPITMQNRDVRITKEGPDGSGINDLTLVSPVVPGAATPIYQGPQGVSVENLTVTGLGELEVELDDGTLVNAGELPVGPGGSDAGVAGYLATPSSDSRAALDEAAADLLDIPTSALAIKTSASYAPIWKTGTAYTAGQVIQAPDGATVVVLTNHTAEGSYDPSKFAVAAGVVDAIAGEALTPGTPTHDGLVEGFVQEGSAFADISKQPGVDPTNTTECAAAIQTALDGFAALGVRAYAKDTFKVASQVTIKGNADLGDSTFNWVGTGTGIAVQVGPGGSGVVLSRVQVVLPRVINTMKTTTGWAQSGVAGTTGVRGVNLDTCVIIVPHVSGFETGFHLYGEGQGSVHNVIHLGHLNTNKVQDVRSADATGWCNDNTVIGGKMSYNSSEGASVAGTRNIHIPVTTNLVNNNQWFGTSLEGDTPEYHVECGGLNNKWWNCRWENGLTGCRVLWITPAAGNKILWGYNAERIVRTLGPGALPQDVFSDFQMDFGNQMPGTAATTNHYSVRINSQGVRVKPYSGTVDRIFLESSTGKVWFGDGTVLNCSFGALGTSGVALYGGHLYSGTDATYDIGLASSLRFRDLNLSRDANIGRNAKALAFVDTQITPTFAAGQIVNFATGALAVLTMTGNITSLGFNGGTAGGLYEVHFVQDATGSRTLTGAVSSIKWAGGTAPTLSTTAGRRDIFRFRHDGTNWYEVTRSMNVG